MLTKVGDTLPQKDAHAFKQLAKFHDAKNYKKGLKHANQLLQTHPDHPETISMKALFELGLGEQNKALETAKVGLMKSKMKSMFCWHTMGTIYKQKRDYLESSKCFQNAYRFEPDNIQLLKDIAAMQIQVRDHSAHVQTRLNILKLKPNIIHNWTAFALANHLKGDYDEMFKAFKSLETLLLAADLKPVEISHFYVYKAVACRDAEKWEMMDEILNKNKDKIKDEVLWHELSFQSSFKLNKVEQAKKYLDFLIKKFPQNIEYMQLYKNLYEIQTDKQVYSVFKETYGSKIAKILYVSVFDQKEPFQKEFSALIKPYYKKNLVSLFAEIQVIYESSTIKRQWIEEVLQQFYVSLKQKTQYPDGEQALSPSQYLWSLYILAQHHGMIFQTLAKALDLINQAIAHTNTVSEFYIVKAQIQYKMHNNIEALQTMNQARKTDLADRYMNNICVKYLFKCQKPGVAEDVMRLFMRDDANAYELQNHWYIIEAGKSFLKRNQLDAGLRHFALVAKQFGDMQSNEFDFHYYCFRKWTLREYTELVAYNDNIFSDKKFIEAAYNAIKYLREYESFIKADEERKKQEQKAEQLVAKKKNKKKKNKQAEAEELNPIETFRKKLDYYGKEFRQTVAANPMEEALKWSKNVVSAKFVNKNNLKENHLYSKANYEAILVFIYFDKPLLVLKSFKKLLNAKDNEVDLKLMTLRVLAYFETCLAKNETHEITKQVLKEFISSTLGQKSSKAYFEELVNYLKSNKNYLTETKVKQAELVAKNETSREKWIALYKSQLDSIIANAAKADNLLQLVFYLVHRLQYYREFSSEQKAKLNEIFGKQTSYFTNWVEAIDKLPDSTWTMWWLSEYDIQRQEMQAIEAKQTEGSDANRKK